MFKAPLGGLQRPHPQLIKTRYAPYGSSARSVRFAHCCNSPGATLHSPDDVRLTRTPVQGASLQVLNGNFSKIIMSGEEGWISEQDVYPYLKGIGKSVLFTNQYFFATWPKLIHSLSSRRFFWNAEISKHTFNQYYIFL